MKKLFSRHKVLKIIMLVVICLSIATGITTRFFLGRSVLDVSKYPSATLTLFLDFGELVPYEENINTLEQAPFVLVVNRKSSRAVRGCTESVVRVKDVKKGTGIQPNEEIILYEYNYFSTYENEGQTLHYIHRNSANLMNDTDDYLVFLYEKDLEDAYYKVNPYRQFVPYGDSTGIAVFNLNRTDKDYLKIPDKKELPYRDFKDREFICFSQKSLDNLNKIKQTVVEKYVGA